MPQSSFDSFPVVHRASALGVEERRAVAAIVKPHVVRFDAWLKEAAFLNAMALATAASDADRTRVRSRSAAMLSEVRTSYDRFATETAGYGLASRVGELRQSYERLLAMLSVHGAA